MGAIDDRIRQFAGMALVGVSGDHGMSAKSTADEKPNVLFLEHVLIEIFGEGAVRVICPIKDPFVRQLAGVGIFADGYLNLTIGLVVPMLEYLYSEENKGSVPAVDSDIMKGGLNLGMVVGQIHFGVLGGIWGRHTIAIASDLSRLEWVWRLLLGIGIVLAALTFKKRGLKEQWVGFCDYFKGCNRAKALFATSAYWFLFDIAYYGINLNQSIILSRIRYFISATPSEKLWKLAIGNLIVNQPTISPVSTLESSSLTASAASDNKLELSP
ncbi:putative inorganic phosphate transporter C23D3.12 [Aspergillus udagawae]|nr:putative inorganic phosphate transporter C23D3.12 [Aspergillus udagawae]